jgi:type I restriction enzyme M protein
MLIKDEETDQLVLGDTLGDGKTFDGFQGKQFHYMLANPPFGVEWKDQQKVITKEHQELGFGGRFGAGLPAINDGSLLFLQHMISKMHPSPKKGGEGSKIAIIFNGSPLFSGDAGSGPSNIRRWIIENDWLDAIVAMPDQLFYNTGIFTYVWLERIRQPRLNDLRARRGSLSWSSSAGEDHDAGELGECVEVASVALVAGDKTAEAQHPGEEAFDVPTPSVAA